MLPPAKSYDDLYKRFAWRAPDCYNIGVDVCDRHADGSGRLALISVDEKQQCHPYSFDDIRRLSNKFANVLVAHGLRRWDRVGIFLPQVPEAAIAHVAAFKAGCISVPLFSLFGEQALEFRLADSSAKAVVTDRSGLTKLTFIADRLPTLKRIYVVGRDAEEPSLGNRAAVFEAELQRAGEAFTPVTTKADDPAMIIYTSGTTGNPRGALHAHRVLLGHLPGVELAHDFFPQPGDLYWTPADWAWIGGLLDVLMPAWHHGVPVLAYRARKFDPEFAMWLMAKHKVRNVFLPPTALKLMHQVKARHGGVQLRTVASGGESLGKELLDWGQQIFGLTINEFYGQTECNMVVSNNARLFPVRPGSMGKAVPGHEVRIIRESGELAPCGEVGFLAVRRPDPVMFLRYWRNESATAEKFVGDWLMTGDLARRDEERYFTFVGRSDDLIMSAGYRLGPSEIENCLIRHPAVSMAAVTGVPDPIRGEVVKAWLSLKPGYLPSEQLVHEIQEFARIHLGAHEYPRHVAFIDELPMTSTGKILRRALRELG